MPHKDSNNADETKVNVSLVNIPRDIMGVILDLLPPVAQISLVRCHSSFYKYAKEKRQNIFKLGDQFLMYVLNGDIEQAKCMVSELPCLLLYKGSVQDSLGRTFSGTALQLALGAKDIKMCEMLKPFFRELEPKHPDEAKKQINEKFDRGFKLKKGTEFRFNFDNLIDVLANEKFIDERISEDTKKALENFRDYFKQTDVIYTGYHFETDQLLDAIWDVERLDDKQKKLHCQEVMKYLVSCIPPHYIARLREDQDEIHQNELNIKFISDLAFINNKIEQELGTLLESFNTSVAPGPRVG